MVTITINQLTITTYFGAQEDVITIDTRKITFEKIVKGHSLKTFLHI